MSVVRRFVRWYPQQQTRVRLAVWCLATVAVGWPATAVLQAIGVPIFEQVMLALSWLAPAFTAFDLLMTAQLHQERDDDGGA